MQKSILTNWLLRFKRIKKKKKKKTQTIKDYLKEETLKTGISYNENNTA